MKRIRRTYDALKEEGSFIQNFAFVFSGKSLVILFSLIFTPLLARIYSPEHYAQFAVYHIIQNNFLVISTFLYSEALLISSKNDLKGVFNLSIALWILFSIVLIVTLGFVVEFVFGLTLEVNFIRLMGLTTIIGGWVAIVSKLNVVRNKFKFQAKINTSSILMSKLYAFSHGFRLSGLIQYGLVCGETLSRTVSAVFHTVVHWGDVVSSIKEFNTDEIIRVSKVYLNYPKVLLPSKYLGMLSHQIVPIALSNLYGAESMGHFSMSMGLIQAPLALLGNSLEGPLLKKTLDEFGNHSFHHIKTLIDVTLMIVLLPALLLSFFGEEILTFILGGDWRPAGVYVSFIISGWLFVIISRITAIIPRVQRRERELFFNSFGVFSTICFAMVIGYFSMNINLTIWVYGLGVLSIGVINARRNLRIAKLRFSPLSLVAIFILFTLTLTKGLALLQLF